MEPSAKKLNHVVLRRIRSLAMFSDDQLDALGAKLSVKTAKPKERILQAGEPGEYSLYILSGEAVSTATDGKTNAVKTVDDDNALLPIAQLRPSMFDIDATSLLEYVEISGDAIAEFSQMMEDEVDHGAGIEVEFIEQTPSANALTIQLCSDIVTGHISLPTMPDVVIRLQKAFTDENSSAITIQNLLQSDPTISAHLLKIANSALYKGADEIDSLQQAIVRMGMEVVHSQVMVFAAKQMFHAKSDTMKQRMQSLWKSCRRVAGFSRVLAKKTGMFTPESAQLAGLLSDLGEVALLQYAQDHSELYNDEEALDQTIHSLRPQINGMLMNSWSLGQDIITVGEGSHDWFRNHVDNADLCDVVMVARFYSYMGTEKADRLPALAKMPAFHKLNMSDLSANDSLAFVKECQHEVELVEQMLGSV